jgi:3',5'-cyclic AMP phosphodiesterase CpdA
MVKDTQLWDLFMTEIEPISKAAPYHVAVGNHDSLPGNDGIECGAVYLHRFKMINQNESSTDFSCATSEATRFWYSFAAGPVWLHTWSTEHAYAAGSSQRAWIEADLAQAAAAKAAGRVSWIIVQMHYPSYCSHSYNGGGGCITDAPLMRRELEALWLAAGVDAVLYGHIHAAEVTWPVFNATPTQLDFVNPKAPVHFLIGMAGAGYLGPWQAEQPGWSAWRYQVYGWTRWHVQGSKRLDFFFYSYLNASAPNWEMSIVRQ